MLKLNFKYKIQINPSSYIIRVFNLLFIGKQRPIFFILIRYEAYQKTVQKIFGNSSEITPWDLNIEV